MYYINLAILEILNTISLLSSKKVERKVFDDIKALR